MNEEKLSTILDNLLGLLLLEGSYDIEEKEDSFFVSIDTQDAGRLIGVNGETLHSLQSLINQISSKQSGTSSKEEFKRVVVDVAGWKKQKEEDILEKSKSWGKQVLETGKDLELEPMSPWQRRLVHMVISEMGGLETESVGEGRDRHVVIKTKGKTKTSDAKAQDTEAAES